MEKAGSKAARVLKVLINIFWVFGLFCALMFGLMLILNLIYLTGWDLIGGSFLLWAISVLILLIIFNLREVIKTVLAEEPFTPENVKRFRTIGLLTFGAGVCYLPFTIINIIKTNIVVLDAGPGYINMPTIGVFLFLFFGLLALVLAEIFRLSYEIKEENKLTI